MKKFLLRLAGFLAFSIGLNVLLLLSVIAANELAVHSCDLGDDVGTIIVGDSHAMWSIDTGEIKGVDNISFNAEGYFYTYFKLKHLLKKEPHISHVYLGFSYHNLSDYYDDYIFGSLSSNFIHRYIGIIPVGSLVKTMLRNPKDIRAFFFQILREGGAAGVKQRCTIYGRFPDEKMDETYDAAQMKKRISAQYYDENGDVAGISENNLEYLDKIIALLRENDIKITLLNTPLHPDYVASIPEEFIDLYHDYIKRNHLHVYEFNDFVLDSSDFLPDGDHVNFDGAMRTTENFRKHLESAP